MGINTGDKVKIEYVGKLDDGSIFDSTEKHGQPLEFEVGSGQVIKGFDQAVMGMEKGEEKDVKIASVDAYGDPNPEMIKSIPRSQLPAQELKAGMVLVMQLPTGQQMPVKIEEIDEKEAKLDLNHPLAGKNLNFNLKVVAINE